MGPMRGPVRRSISVFLLGIGAACPSVVVAEDGAREPRKPREVFEALTLRVLPRADTVVVGTARVVREGVGGAATLVSVAVEEVLKGTAASTITVFVAGPRNTADPSNPSAPWFPDTRPHRCALFLRTAPNGSGYGLETLFFAEGAEGKEKVDVLAKEVRIVAVQDLGARRRKALAHLLDLVGGDLAWSRAHAAKELEVLVDVAPEVFDADARTELHAARRKTFDPSTRAALSRVLSRLPQTAGTEPPGGGPTPGRAPPLPPAAPDPTPAVPPPAPPPEPLPPIPPTPLPPSDGPSGPPCPPPPPREPLPAPDPAAPPSPIPTPPEEGATRPARPANPPSVPPSADAPPHKVGTPPHGPGLSAEYLRARRRIGEVTDTEGRLAGMSELAALGKAGAGPDLLAAFRADDPTLRERAAVLLGDVGATEAWPTLREAFGTERSPEVREALVRAAGLLGDARTVPWVVARLEEAPLRTSALMALARLRTPAALGILADRQQEALSASPPDEATARLLSYLRSPAFEAAEKAVGRAVGPRRAPAAAAPDPSPDAPAPRPETPR